MRVHREGVDFFRGRSFQSLQNAFDNACRRLHNEGVSTARRPTPPISDEEEEQLWREKVIGCHNPVALLRAVFFLNGKNFCLRGGQEHRMLGRKQLIRTPPDFAQPVESYKYVEFRSKNNPGGRSHLKVANKRVVQHALPEQVERCHCFLLDEYLKRLPYDARDNAFYLKPLPEKPPAAGAPWFYIVNMF